MTIIVDMHGNEHRVPNVKNVRTDLTPEEIQSEVEKFNQENKKEKGNDESSHSKSNSKGITHIHRPIKKARFHLIA